MTQTLVLTRGDDRIINVTVVFPAAFALQDLGDCDDLRFTVKSAITDTDSEALMQKTLASGITVTDTDTATIAIDAADWDAWDSCTPTQLVWDLEGRPPVTTLQYGTLVVVQDVTRDAP